MNRVVLFLLSLFPFVANGQIITTIAGNGIASYNGDGIQATAAQLKLPDVVRLDAIGNLYVADQANHRIRKISTDGIISTVAGNGMSGYMGDGGQATDAKLKHPSDITFDAVGNLYIAEMGNGVIRKVTTSGVITTIAGTGTIGYSGDDGPATAAQLFNPLGLVFDAIGNLYFSVNGKYRIRKINTSGIVTTVVGTGTSGYSGDNGPATAATIAETGCLAIGPSGELFIPQYGSNAIIRKLDASGIITTVVGNGTVGYSGDNGTASASTLSAPYVVIFDQHSNMFISDRYRIRKVNAAGIITTIAGNGSGGYGGDGGPATSAQFGDYMTCSAVDATGNLYIADRNNYRVRKITYANSAVNEVAQNPINLIIYPNPAHSEVTISSTEKTETITLINAVGQVADAAPLPAPNEREVRLHVEHLPAGIYFVKVNGVYAGRFLKE